METICTYSMTNILGGDQTILRIQILQKNSEEASTNEASNQKIQRATRHNESYQKKDRYYDKIEKRVI